MLGRLAVIGGLALTIFVTGKIANFATGVGGSGEKAPFVVVESKNPQLDAAHAKARNTIGEFWAARGRKDPALKNFTLKVRFPVEGHGDSGEHVWLADVRPMAEGGYTGRLDNEPRFLPSMKIGDRLKFTDGMISDWMFTRNGKIVGNESMRPLLARMPKAEGDKLRAMLENP